MNLLQLVFAIYFAFFCIFTKCDSCKECCTNCKTSSTCVLYCDICSTEDLFTEIAPPTIRAVHVVMRHGNRSPIFSYPNDPHGNDTARWKRRPAELTNAGIIQMRNVGKYLKARYASIASCDPKTRSIIRSSQTSRCIESAKVVAKVLCPPSSDIYDMPTTILSLPAAVDELLYWKPYCPAFTEESARVKISHEWRAHIAKRKEFYETIAKQSGFDPEDSVKVVHSVYDVLLTERYERLPSPKWATDEIFEMLKEDFSIAFSLQYSSNITLRLQAGPILKKISGFFKNYVFSDRKYADNSQITIYSTHDDKITSILNAIGANQKFHPPFAASILFELHNINGRNYVAIRYLDQTENAPYSSRILTVPCSDKSQDDMCSLDEFIGMIDPLVPDNWREECGIPKEFDPYKTLLKCGAATSDHDLEYCMQFA